MLIYDMKNYMEDMCAMKTLFAAFLFQTNHFYFLIFIMCSFTKNTVFYMCHSHSYDLILYPQPLTSHKKIKILF